MKPRGGRRDAPGKVLKDRRSPRQRGRMGTSVWDAPDSSSSEFESSSARGTPAAAAAAIASAFPSALHSPSPTLRHAIDDRTGGARGGHASTSAASTSGSLSTRRARSAPNRYHAPSRSTPIKSPTPSESAAIASTTATSATRPRGRLNADDVDDDEDGVACGDSSESASSNAATASAASAVLGVTAFDESAEATSSSPSATSSSAASGSSTDHDPSGMSPIVFDFGLAPLENDGGRFRPGRITRPSSATSSSSTSASAIPSSISRKSLIAARAISAFMSQLCLEMIFIRRRSSFSRSSSFTYRRHSSRGTIDSPISICSRKASACCFSRRSSFVCSRFALPPR